MVLLVASRKDSAGMNIARHLEGQGHKIHYVEEEITLVTELPETKDIYIFLSKHCSMSGKKSLTAHFTGNFGEKAEVGGEPRSLGISAPSWIKGYMKRLFQVKDLAPEFEIVVEATHHGPTHFKSPIMFVEIGSKEEEWNDEEVGRAVAIAVDATIKDRPHFEKVGLGFGGPHYSNKFTQFLLETDFTVSHILPVYMSDYVCLDIMDKMVERSGEKPTYVIIEKKMKQKERVTNWAMNKGYGIVRI